MQESDNGGEERKEIDKQEQKTMLAAKKGAVY
jgi:hypothetical protein